MLHIQTKLDWGVPGIHELFAWLYDNQSELLLTSGISGGSGGAGGEVLQENGLYAGHEYSLLKLEGTDNSYFKTYHVRVKYYAG